MTFADLVEEHSALVRSETIRQARLCGVPRHQVEDLRQLVWVSLWKQTQDPGSELVYPAAWIRRVARNQAARLARRWAPLPEHPEPPTEDRTEDLREDLGIGDRMFFYELVASLSAEQQELLELWRTGQSYAAIGRQRGTSRQAAQQALARILKYFRRRLTERRSTPTPTRTSA